MSKRAIYLFWAAFTAMLGYTGSAQAQESALSNAIADLSSPNTETIIAALEKMGRICDESCVPWLSDMMRHPEHTVIQAACRAAQATGNPRLAPPLMELIRRHPMNEIRLDALKALTRMERPEDYHALLATIDPENPDEIQRKILRSLPKDMRKPLAKQFAAWARHAPLVTSIADAYREEADVLFQAVYHELMQTTDELARQNLFRTWAILTPHLPPAFALTHEQEALFWDNPEPYLAWIASIQAHLASPDAVRWILAWAHTLPNASRLEVMEKLHGEGARQFADAVIQAKDDNMLTWERDIATNPALTRAFLKLLAKYPGKYAKTLALSLRYSKNTDTAILAWQILGHFAEDPDVQKSFMAQMGLSNPQIAAAAMQIMAKNPILANLLIPVGLEFPDFDGIGRTYLARWGLVLAIHDKTADIDADNKQKLVQNALHVLGDSRRLHAEPALRLLDALEIPLDLPAVEAFEKMRPDMKRTWLQILKPAQKHADKLVWYALNDSDASVKAQAWQILANHPEWLKDIDKEILDGMILKTIQHDDIMAALQAVVAAAQLERTSLIETLQHLLTHEDTRLAYNALWALQKLRALPHAPWLKSLYYRTSDGLLRERLGFLTGLSNERQENVEMAELYTRQPVHSGELLQIQNQYQPWAAYQMTYIQANQSLAIEKSNVFGFIYVP